jgi:dTDP-4-dehydrorhamnose 3,5-epimerase-like enzyme
MKTTLNDVLFFKSKQLIEQNGNLIPIEFDNTLLFKPKRTFFIYNVSTKTPRGKHAHHKTKQILFCINGKITVILNDGKIENKYELESGDCIYIPHMIWDEQIYHSKETVLISLCNTHYNISDYIINFEEFKKLKNGKK